MVIKDRIDDTQQLWLTSPLLQWLCFRATMKMLVPSTVCSEQSFVYIYIFHLLSIRDLNITKKVTSFRNYISRLVWNSGIVWKDHFGLYSHMPPPRGDEKVTESRNPVLVWLWYRSSFKFITVISLKSFFKALFCIIFICKFRQRWRNT